MIPDITLSSGGAPGSASGPSRRLSPNRAPFEFYPTPPEATRAFIAAETFDGPIWEPACGQGAISKVLEKSGDEVVSTDLANYGYGKSDVDFLQTVFPRAKHIVTMLLNLASLCHPVRHESFIRRPPSRIYALDDCVCYPNGDARYATRQTNTHRYAWLVWTNNPVDQTSFHWLTTAPYKNGGA